MQSSVYELRERMKRALSGTTVQEATSRVRAIVGPIAEGDAKRAIEKLERNEKPTPLELAALEMLVRLMRPSLLCQAGTVADLPPDNKAFANWASFRQAVKPYLYCIGRIDAVAPDDAGKPDPPDAPVGTGFLIAHIALMTNAHVLNVLSHGTFELALGQAVVRLKRQFNEVPDEPPVAIEGVIAYDRQLDVALLRLGSAPTGDGRQPLVLETAPPAAGQGVAAVGYPSKDSERNPLFVNTIFGNRFAVKRAAPGELTSVDGRVVYHDCSTLGGNSGSPLLSLASAKVIGIHRHGDFLYSNEAVPAAALTDFLRGSDADQNGS